MSLSQCETELVTSHKEKSPKVSINFLIVIQKCNNIQSELLVHTDHCILIAGYFFGGQDQALAHLYIFGIKGRNNLKYSPFS